MIRRALALCLVGAYLSFAACSSSGPQSAPSHPSTGAPSATPSVVTSPPAENDPQRTKWRIEVEPFVVLGSGHPGKGDTDFDKPDGVAFTPNGLLLATDARNRRVQVWDIKDGVRVGEFGHRTFGGEIVDIAVSPNGNVFVSDQKLNLVYAFRPPKPGEVDPDDGMPISAWDYQFIGTKFGEQNFDKLGGIAVDAQNRIYCVDAHLNDVKRFTPDFTSDPTWHFAKTRADGDTYLHGCEGIAINEATGDLFVASEKDTVIQVFDEATGKYRGRLIGARNDGGGKPSGKKVFFSSVEGLALAGGFLFAVDEGAGHMQVFNLSMENVFNTDLLAYTASGVDRTGGYVGFFGHAPKFDFENKADVELQRKVKDGQVVPGQLNPPGYFCSPDSISAYTERETGETFVAIADQCNYRLAIYKLSEILKAAGSLAPAHPQAPSRPLAGVLPETQQVPHPAHVAPHSVAHKHAPPPAPPDDGKKKKKDKKKKHEA